MVCRRRSNHGTRQVLGVMAVLAVGFTIVITVLVPMLAPMPG